MVPVVFQRRFSRMVVDVAFAFDLFTMLSTALGTVLILRDKKKNV